MKRSSRDDLAKGNNNASPRNISPESLSAVGFLFVGLLRYSRKTPGSPISASPTGGAAPQRTGSMCFLPSRSTVADSLDSYRIS
ncbi:hypothetical protein DTO280E4_8658 [Paecilomyces variotii]|nr:hypothetical protein DTO280E4_8658 [Paecilomyces variotii]KAJ9375314.1 hypothetical protein DTO282E5_298 [Paecilomyces variotii]KAJ9396856.1 hypothetical protein DTO282F9_6259 [Paecilomyces variotii]